jgi:hypothetical protein
MWDDAPYSALTATLKIRNVGAENFLRDHAVTAGSQPRYEFHA